MPFQSSDTLFWVILKYSYLETVVVNQVQMCRFDIEGEEETLNFTPQEYPQVPTTLVPSPPKEQPPQGSKLYSHKIFS